MKKLVLLAFVQPLLLLAACEGPTPSTNATSTPSAVPTAGTECGLLANSVADEKALYSAEAAYNIPANAYVSLDSAGKLSVETKEKVKPWLIGAYDALTTARRAYELGRTCDLHSAVDQVKGLASKAREILPNAE